MNMQAIKAKLARAVDFMTNDVWDIELSSLSSLRRTGVKALRVVQLVFRGFREDECPLHASALTFSTLMSIVPVLALSLALARGLGGGDTAKEKLRSAVREWTGTFSAEVVVTNVAAGGLPEESHTVSGVRETNGLAAAGAAAGVLQPSALAVEIDKMVEAGFDKVENISFAALGGVGLVLLLWMVIQVLGRVEASFNRVWGVAEGRSIWRKFTDYLSILFILPVLIVAASSVPVVDFATRFLNDDAADVVRAIVGSGLLKAVTVLLMSTLCFSFLLTFMPNTKVDLLPALAGGFITALLFLGWIKACAALQVGVARWGTIYGSFATVPILLAWVYMSWQIIFFGAEVAFSVQNCSTFRMEQGARRASVRSRILLALTVVAAAARAMLEGSKTFDINLFARERRVPVRFLNDVVAELVQAGLLAELSERQGSYVLLKSPQTLSVTDVIGSVLQTGTGPQRLGLGRVEPSVQKIADKLVGGIDAAINGMTVQDLLGDAG